jgi:phosphoribosyl-ATP pyrophosphohydrolase
VTGFTLDDLARTIAERARVGDASASYTAKLLADGVTRCAQKLGEEAVEAAIAAVTGDRRALTEEAADVLYHLLVTLQASGVKLADVMAALQRRTSHSGVTEKASRPAKGS